MKRLLTILLILCGTLTYGQSAKHRTVGTDTTCIDTMRVALYMVGDLFLPIKGHFPPQWDSSRALAYSPWDSSVYVFTKYNWIKIGGAAGLGTVTRVTAGAGLSGGDITTTGTISMPDVGTAGTYGDATHIPAITTDAQGRVTGVTTYTFTSGGSTLDTSYIYAAILLKKDKSDSLPGTGYTTRDRLQAKADSIIAWAEATFLSTETDPVFLSYPAAGIGAGDISNWDNAYSNRITSLTTSGSSGAATLISNTLNVPEYTASGLGAIATTEATVTPTPNKILKRDAYGNGYVNNLIQNGTSTAAANGTTAMDLASTLFQEQTGSSGNDHTYVLPDATTLTEFTAYTFDNNSDGLMVVNNHTGTLVVSIGAGGKYEVRLKDNATAAGTWDKHAYLPLGTNATTAGIQYTGFVSASGSVTGSNLSNTNTGDQNTFTSIPVSGQTTVTANSTTTALTLVAGSGVVITTDNTAKSITITATGGSGTVTTVTANALSPLFTSSVSNPTTTPAISYTLSNAGAYSVLCNTTNGAAAPAYSKIDVANMVYGITATANGGTGTTAPTSVNATPITYGSNNTITVPIATGVTGLGTGVATWAATPSSSNLASALTDETGTGAAVFATKPTFVGTIHTPSAVAASAFDGSAGNYFTRTLTSSQTFTQSNFSTGQNFIVVLTQGSGTSYNPTWWSGITWVTSGGTAPTMTTTSNGITTYGFTCTGSSTFLGYLVGTQ